MFFAFIVFGIVCLVLAKRLTGKNVSEMACFVSSGTKDHNQSISRSSKHS